MTKPQIEWRQIGSDESAGFIVYRESFSPGGGLSWKRWCGPWGGMAKAQRIIDREIAPKYADATFMAAEMLLRPIQKFVGDEPQWNDGDKLKQAIIPAYQERVAELRAGAA